MHVCEDFLIELSMRRCQLLGRAFHERPASGQECAYLGHITVGSADLLSQSITLNAYLPLAKLK